LVSVTNAANYRFFERLGDGFFRFTGYPEYNPIAVPVVLGEGGVV
jgi:hypothetical protein